MIKHYLTGQKRETTLIPKRRKWETNSIRTGRHIILSKHRGGYCREAQVQEHLKHACQKEPNAIESIARDVQF